MTDLRALAYELLREAQQELREESDLNPTAVVITPTENLIFDIEYETEEERDEIYSEMLEIASERYATAIITVNDTFLGDSQSPVQLQGTGWGALAASPSEAILITVSGRGFQTWSLRCPYLRRDDQIVFYPSEEQLNPGGEIELLGDWTGNSGSA